LEAKSIPPCFDSLTTIHSRRTAYQSYIWRQCLVPKPIVPSPDHHGWEVTEEGISIK